MSEHNLTLTEGVHAPAHARAWANARAGDLPRAVVEDMLLLVSELVTNAVRHGEPEVSLRLALRPDRVRIDVYDGSDVMPVVPAGQPSIDRPTGRGLLIVAATAADWGIERSGDRPGKTVWAELHTNPSQTLPNQPDRGR